MRRTAAGRIIENKADFTVDIYGAAGARLYREHG